MGEFGSKQVSTELKALAPGEEVWMRRQERILLGCEFAVMQGVDLAKDLNHKNAAKPSVLIAFKPSAM